MFVGGSSQDAVPSSQAYIATPNVMDDSTWLLDSGATHHVTENGDSLAYGWEWLSASDITHR